MPSGRSGCRWIALDQLCGTSQGKPPCVTSAVAPSFARPDPRESDEFDRPRHSQTHPRFFPDLVEPQQGLTGLANECLGKSASNFRSDIEHAVTAIRSVHSPASAPIEIDGIVRSAIESLDDDARIQNHEFWRTRRQIARRRRCGHPPCSPSNVAASTTISTSPLFRRSIGFRSSSCGLGLTRKFRIA